MLLVGALILAVLKPWAPPPVPEPTHTPLPTRRAVARTEPPASAPPATPAAPVVTPTPWPSGAVRFRCLGGRNWMLVTDETHDSIELWSWARLDPYLGATGPDDPLIPWYRAGADAVRALGVCLPNPPGGPGATPVPGSEGAVIVVRTRTGEPTAGAGAWVEAPAVRSAGDLAVFGGEVVAPLAGTANGAWPEGDYVVEVRPGFVGPSAWFGLHIVGANVTDGLPWGSDGAPPPSSGEPRPSASPSPS